jgi:ATP-binding cassette subfamily C (CFTR/MRP) protein 1
VPEGPSILETLFFLPFGRFFSLATQRQIVQSDVPALSLSLQVQNVLNNFNIVRQKQLDTARPVPTCSNVPRHHVDFKGVILDIVWEDLKRSTILRI